MILHILLITIFIVIIYFTYGLYLEKIIFEKQVKYIFNKLNKITKAIDPNFKFSNIKYINTLKIEDEPKVIEKIDKHNNELKKKAGFALSIMIIASLIIIILIGKKYDIIDENGKKIDMLTYIKTLLKMNIIVLLFISMTYISFITFVGYNYIYINDSYIVKKILDNIL